MVASFELPILNTSNEANIKLLANHTVRVRVTVSMLLLSSPWCCGEIVMEFVFCYDLKMKRLIAASVDSVKRMCRAV